MKTGININLRQVQKSFGANQIVLSDFSIDIAAGDFVTLIGPSGSGKSTLLRLVAGLEQPTAGTVELRAQPDSLRQRHRLAYVFQDAHLLPWRDVQRNVELPLEFLAFDAEARKNLAKQALAEVGLAGSESLYPAQLSGGMKMRASLARALVTSPDLLLLDEPFGALDEISRGHLEDLIRAVWLRRRMTIVFVTHSLAEAVYLGERTLILAKGNGQILLDRRSTLETSRDRTTRQTPAFFGAVDDLFDVLERS